MSAPGKPVEAPKAAPPVVQLQIAQGGCQSAIGLLSGTLTSQEGYTFSVGRACIEVRRPNDAAWNGLAVFIPFASVRCFTTRDL